MLTKVDWISFSIPMDTSKMENEQDAVTQVVASLDALHPDLGTWLLLDTPFTVRNGRAPYRTAWAREIPGLTIFTHPSLPHALIEVSGSGCDRLTIDKVLLPLLAAVQKRVTRIDVACDILTDMRPKDFGEDRDIGRFKASSYVYSETGETYYVGAKTSNRYCRVYRYNKPHERWALLRVEYVYKAESAKALVIALLEQGLGSVVAASGQAFGWRSPIWRIDDDAAELAVYRPDRKQGKTLFWLADTVAPLLARLQKEGVIDVRTWVEEHVEPLLQN